MRFVRVAGMAELEAADGVLSASVERRGLALYLVEGEVFATDDLCTHGAARLSEGYLDGHLIECPLHQGLFDVRDGSPAGAPCVVPVKSFPVRVEGGDILIGLEG